jgi:hypothetical protein
MDAINFCHGYTQQLNTPRAITSADKSLESKGTETQPSQTDAFSMTTAESKNSSTAKPSTKTVGSWLPLLGGAFVLGGVGLIAFLNKKQLGDWLAPKKLEELKKPILEIPIEEPLEEIKTETINVVSKNQQLLQAMHEVFCTGGIKRDGKNRSFPYTLKIYTDEQIKPTLATDYTAGVDAIKDASHLYLGDLHGSWLKAVLHLAQFEAIQMPKATAEELLQIHHAFDKLILEEKTKNKGNNALDFTELGTKQAVHELVGRFKTALEQVEWTDEAKQLNLIGDVLGDRGQLDLFTLLLMDKFKNNINIVTSNHDLEALHFLRGFQTNKVLNKVRLECKQFDSATRLLYPTVALPDEASKLLSTTGITNPQFTAAEVIDLYKQYFSRLNLVQYDAKDESLMIHCLLRGNTWNELIRLINPENPLADESTRKDLSQEELITAFNDINTQFKTILTEELNHPSEEGAVKFKTLTTFLNDEVWQSDSDGRVTAKDPHLSFPDLGLFVKKVMIGHSDYQITNQPNDRKFYALNNMALKGDAMVFSASSPIVVT